MVEDIEGGEGTQQQEEVSTIGPVLPVHRGEEMRAGAQPITPSEHGRLGAERMVEEAN